LGILHLMTMISTKNKIALDSQAISLYSDSKNPFNVVIFGRE